MKKTIISSYILGMVVLAMALASCESNETYEKKSEGSPIVVRDTVNIEKSKKIFSLDSDKKSAMGFGWGWNLFKGLISISTTDTESPLNGDYENGGISRSDGRVLHDTIPCGESFIDVAFTPADTATTEDISTPDSIGNKTVQVYTGDDGQVLTLEDSYKYRNIESTISWPFYVPSSEVAHRSPIRYEYNPLNPNERIVWITVEVTHEALNAENGTNLTQAYEIGYVQVKDGAVEPEKDPYEVRIKSFDLFRTYRKKTQHSICEGVMAFAVYNSRTGELVEEISTDDFAMQLAKCGHFGSPSNGYIVGEARLVGSAPTSVTEKVVPDNEEALTASHEKGNFKVVVTCTAQDYYVHFPVRGRDDSEGGMEAGGQNLFFQAEITYTSPDGAWTKTWKFTHKTDVNVVGWETRTPQVDRSSETVNDVDGVRNLKYEKSFVVEFVNHLYLDGEEIVQVEGDDDFYYPVSKTTGTTKPFHTSDMVIDCWTSYLP
jgi:hypothetical protein